MKYIPYLTILLISLSVVACKKDNSVKAYPDLIVGQWDFKKEIIKSGAAPDTVITKTEKFTYNKDGTLVITRGSGDQSKLRYYLKNDTLVHVHHPSYATGYDPSTEIREGIKIKKLDNHNLVIIFTYDGIPQSSKSYFFSERTFSR
jgi:hypothetical protein